MLHALTAKGLYSSLLVSVNTLMTAAVISPTVL